MRRSTLDRPPRFHLAQAEGAHIRLDSDGAAVVHLWALEEDIVRVLVLPDGTPKQPRTFAIAPGAEDIADGGRDRLDDLAGFALPAPHLRHDREILVLETDRVRLSVALDGFKCRWEIFDGEWKNAALDRPTQAYDFGWWDGRPRHFLAREGQEFYFGLGERSGDLNRAGRRFRMRNLDAFGYDARSSDPLYKHLPFTITRRPREGISYGLFYDTLSDCDLDLGCERSNYHGLYRAFEADHGDLDYYFIAGPELGAVVRRFTWLTGRPALMPDWALGFSGSSMGLADAPDAEQALLGYADECAARNLPCASLHLSSGYTGGAGRRHVFTWDQAKFPEPRRFIAALSERGVRVIANIKPALLTDHPLFGEARALGLFITEPDGTPALAQFWGGLGAYLDFTNADAAAWWKAKVKEGLLELGVAATWNDNNEFEISSPSALAKGLAEGAPASRAVQPLLMMRASWQAQREHNPGARPYLVSRSGCAGMQRYAQTWSGDNTTAWETLRYNIRMGLGLALSGISNSGHDVGGFAGPAPDPELLVRWVELGVFMPRFSIHSWNADGQVSSPWMHEGVAGKVAALLALRFRIQPYLSYLSWCYSRCFEPIWRPVLYDFPGDPQAWAESDEFMLGPSLLIAPVVEAGARHRTLRPPAGADWIDPWTGARFAGGEAAVLDAPLGRPPFLARAGSIVPVNRARAGFGVETVEPGLMLFPADVGHAELELLGDDGVSPIDVAEARPAIRIEAEFSATAIHLRADGVALTAPAVFLPPGETRPLHVSG